MEEVEVWNDEDEMDERVKNHGHHVDGMVNNPSLPRTWTCLEKTPGTTAHSSDGTRPRTWRPLWLCRSLARAAAAAVAADGDEEDERSLPSHHHNPLEKPRSDRSRKVLSRLHPPSSQTRVHQ